MADGYEIIYDKAHWSHVIESLRLADHDAVRDFQEALDEASGPILEDVRAHALGLPAHGPKHTGLRARLAAGVTVAPDGSGDAAIKFDAHEPLSGVTDNGPAGWRHPVYGNMANWVHQDGGSWFKEIIPNHEGQVSAKLDAALSKLADSIG